MEILRISLIALNALVLLFLGLTAFLLLGNLWAGLVLQIAPFLSVTLVEECFTKVAPEQLLFTAVSVLVMSLIKYSRCQERGTAKYSILFGLIAGFGLATKMTFLPFLIIPLIVLVGKQNKWIYIFSVPLSFVLFTLPAVTVYPQMAYWFLNLGTHTGTYGQGSSGIIDFSQYFSALLQIAINNKALIIVLIVGIITLVYFYGKSSEENQGEEKNMRNQLIAVVIAIAASIMMVAKHYHCNHYLFPAFSIIGYVVVLVIILCSDYFKNQFQSINRFLFPSLFVVITGVALLNIPFLTQAYNGYRASNQSTSEAESRLNTEYAEFSKVYYYPGSFNNFASLKWGNVYARQYNTDKLMELFPEVLFYNTSEKCFQQWETKITPEALLEKCKSKILLVGGPRTDDEFRQVEKDGFKLQKLFEGRVQAAYDIDIENSAIFNTGIKKSNQWWSVTVDFEKISPNGRNVLSSGGTKFCSNSSLSTKKGKSGTSSIALAEFDSYAMDYELTDVRPNDYYEISIWRYGSKKDAFLIVSAGSADPLYLQTDGYSETNTEGWQKIEISVKIPNEFKSNKLKIYLWNHSKSPVWFDDFCITKY